MGLSIDEEWVVIVKKECRPARGFTPKRELVVIDKPAGPFSYVVTDEVKRVLGARRAGHAGTLDPKVTGVLPIAFNNSTKVLTALRTDKEYVGVMRLHGDVDEGVLRESSKSFIGVIKQLPPVRSAVKRVERLRRVYYLRVLSVKGRDVKFVIGCEAGTYVRKLCHDWGVLLGVGAHMKFLRRTRVGCLTLRDAVSIEDFKVNPCACLLPVERAVCHLRKVWVDDFTVKRVRHGSKVFVPGVCKFSSGLRVGELVAVMSVDDELVALGECEMSGDELSHASKGLVVSLKRVM